MRPWRRRTVPPAPPSIVPKLLTWERTPSVEEMMSLEAGQCVCGCGARAVPVGDGWARCEHSDGHEFRLTSQNGAPVLMYRWYSDDDYIWCHNQLKMSFGMSHDCELHRLITSMPADEWAAIKEARLVPIRAELAARRAKEAAWQLSR